MERKEKSNTQETTERYPPNLIEMGRKGAKSFDRMYKNANLIDFVLENTSNKRILLALGAVGGGGAGKKVTEFIYSAVRKNPKKDEKSINENKVAWINEIDELSSSRRWGKANFFHSDFKHINDCAYFDYQRQRVFIRTSKTIKKNIPKPHLRRNHPTPSACHG